MTEFLAGSNRMNFPQPPQLFAGSLEVTTNRRQVADNLKFQQYEVIAIVADKIVKFDPEGDDGSEVAAGIIANSVDTTTATGVAGQWSGFYTGGDFNHAALVWPAALTTLAQRRAVFATTATIAISSVL
ncbi:Bacteriophage lambda head decoration protein D [Pseudomonas citronellolis]|uniref:Bacteriophage lambda head decoration protein D n=1 Tax=Pseudomonas citronellolis TaxID=53408 RepID=A0AAQ1KJ37_9PSED|nr:head decoration protein [Pseudomonas citronellolis]TGC32421.1 head decoration protein [Pseudomonas citronellolis]SFD52329.1 Bacteriophage lambda head decoration protein D [Pseudomonas citronellolis]